MTDILSCRNMIRSISMMSASVTALSAAQAQTVVIEEGQTVGPQNAQRLYNYGEIDGDAVRAFWSYGGYGDPVFLQNDGVIRNNSWLPTIQAISPYASIVNTGTIRNDGTGSAILVSPYLNTSIVNTKGALIEGATAISAAPLFPYEFGSFSLINGGTIRGDVIGYVSSDSVSLTDPDTGDHGLLDGNLFLDWGDDYLSGVTFDPDSGQITNITGTVDGGEGTDTVIFDIAADATLHAMPTAANFEDFGFTIANEAVVTLAADFVSPSTIHIAYSTSSGTLINEASLQTTGPAIQSNASTAFDNRGSVFALLSDYSDAAVSLGYYASLTNSGTINAVGGRGVAVSSGEFTNSGLIVADAEAASLVHTTGTNSGTIQSRNRAGLTLFGNQGTPFTNTGLIEGATAGVQSNMSLINSGTIRGGETGVALDPYGTVYNQSGGVISGGTEGAITAPLYGYAFNTAIYNAGTINGDVNLGGFPSYYGSNNIYVALPGGVLNGDLYLGGGNDTFVTDLVNTGSGAFAGVTGTVSGGENETIRYRVDSDISASIALPTGFANVGYQLENDARLTLTGSMENAQLMFAGQGTVDLNADISGSGYTLMFETPAIGLPNETLPENALTINNRGTLTFTRGDDNLAFAAVNMNAGTSFNNAGSIVIHNATGNSSQLYGIVDGYYGYYGYYPGSMAASQTTNSGAIWLDGAIGILASSPVVNTGTIGQLADGRQSFGIISSSEVTNSGLISTGGTAVTFSSYYYNYGTPSLANSGTIRSTDAAAVSGYTYASFTIINEAQGVIEGGNGTAITLNGAANITNAGTINGDVHIGGNPYYYNQPSTFISAGALNGDLTFGSGDDMFIQRGATTGVTGTIDAGDGRDAFGRSYTTSQTVALGAPLPATFEEEFFEAFGSDTVLTLTGSSEAGSRVVIGGLGQFVNKGAIGGQIVAGAYDGDAATSLVNDGTVEEGVIGQIGHLVNNGTIGGFVQIGGVETTELINNGSIHGSVHLGDTEDVIDSRNGTISGDIYLAGGDDRLVIAATSLGDAFYSGGDGLDTLEYAAGGTTDVPGGLSETYYGFEQLKVSGGVLGYQGDHNFTYVNVSGGRLVGAAGSVFEAPLFLVGPGGTFGSAGTVNGSVVVAGTLSPGASPGTMTINGDVSLTTGSTTLFEMTPIVSDAIVIDGALAIATGATLKLTGERPLTPGTSYDLITASEGITGSFSIIDKEPGVVGLVQQGEDSIQLLGQFALDPGVTPNVQASQAADYLNALLVDSTVANRIIDAVPLLTDAAGFADATKLRLLTPEVYASASQIGIENGLALASAARTTTLTDRSEAGPFTFGQWFGNWRTMPGRESLGTAKADISTRGLIGGVGFGSDAASVGAFVGYIDATQRIDALGAKTESDGVVAGFLGQMKMGGAEFAILTAFDGSKADTRRTLPDASAATSRYKMHGWTTDVRLGYAFAIGDGWNLKPSVGVTHIRSTRDGAAEAGGSPLALVVEGHRTKATFLNADLTIKGSPEDRIQPWLSAGVRHQTDGDAVTATAALTGIASSFSVPGAPRDRTQATVSAGLGAAISPMATLFFGVSSEFGANSNGQSANGGLKLRF